MKYIKYLIIPFCLILAVASIYYGCNERRKRIQTDQRETEQKKAVQAEASIIARKVDKQGLEHVTIEASQNVIPSKDVNKVAVSEGILDTTAMYIGILKNQIENLQRVSFTSEARALKAEHRLDSMGRVVKYFTNKWIDISYSAPDSSNYGLYPDGQFGYHYRGELQSTQYTVQKKLFNFIPIGKRKSYIDVFLNDSNAVVNNVKRLSIVKDDPFWALHLQGSSSYNPDSRSFGFGPAIRLDVGRTNFQVNRLYYPSFQRWQWLVSCSFDLVRL